jgi:hypothetical protein
MSEARDLLEKATPLPWETDEVHGETCVRNEDGEAIVPWTGLTDDINYRLIVYAVNHLPDYLAAVEALAAWLDWYEHMHDYDAPDPVLAGETRDVLARLQSKEPA